VFNISTTASFKSRPLFAGDSWFPFLSICDQYASIKRNDILFRKGQSHFKKVLPPFKWMKPKLPNIRKMTAEVSLNIFLLSSRARHFKFYCPFPAKLSFISVKRFEEALPGSV
jgi:hypothetical protein